MHELSIAQSIIEIVQHNVPEGQWPLVRTVKVKVGDFSGVVPESLDFSFSAIVAESPMDKASLTIERIPFVVACSSCHATSNSENGFATCPACGSYETRVVSGTELQVMEIELDD